MMQLKKILFPTDFSRCADQALTQAVYLTGQFGAQLDMLHVIVLHGDDAYTPAYPFQDMDEIHARLQETATARMRAAIEAHEVGSVKIHPMQGRGIAAAPVILEVAENHESDLIVMGTHGRRGLRHLLLGSVAEEVVRLAPCPVLTIGERQQANPVEALERVLVPVDFSVYSQRALATAKEIAASYDARLQLLHVIEETIYPAFYMSSGGSLSSFVPELEVKSRQALQEMIHEAKGPDVVAEIHVIQGHAARDIVKFADSQASDLIVIATHGLTGIEHLLLGSTTEKVVRMAPCPVFTVKAFGKSPVEA